MPVTIEDLEKHILSQNEKIIALEKKLAEFPGRPDLENLKSEIMAGLSEDRKILALLKAKHDSSRGPGKDDPDAESIFPFL